MKINQPGREEGNAKEEGRRKHQHMKPSPKRATLKRHGKRKAEADEHGTRPAEGGKGRTRLNQPTCREEDARTHEIRDPWGTS